VGCANELQTIKQQINNYPECDEENQHELLTKYWKPFCPPFEEEIIFITDHVCREVNMIRDELSLDEKLIEKIEFAQQKNHLVIIIVDPWTLQLPNPLYLKMMNLYDRSHFFNCGLLVLFNEEDQETHDHYSLLQEMIEQLFFTKILDNSITFRNDIHSLAQFEQELKEILQQLRERIIRSSQRVRRVEGENFLGKPLLINNEMNKKI
jgi:FxsC-like protein